MLGARACLFCGASTTHRRRGARTCGGACRKKLHRHGFGPRLEVLGRALGCSPRDFWRTPKALFDVYDAQYGFVLDAAATQVDTLCERFIDPGEDALSVGWAERAQGGAVWVNPPYGKAGGGLLAWIEKCVVEARRGGPVVALIPPSTGTRYWAVVHREVEAGRARVELLVGRVAFVDPTSGEPVAGNRGESAVVTLFSYAVDGGAAGYCVRTPADLVAATRQPQTP